MTTVGALVTRIEAHCSAKKIAESTFGRIAVNDGKLVKRLRDGGSITLETLDRIERALAEPAAFLPAQPIAKCAHCGASIADKQSCGRAECPAEPAAKAAA